MKLLRIKGFTLIELMVTLSILSVVAAATMPYMTRQMDRVQVKKGIAEIQHVLIEARDYRVENGSWPASVDVLISAGRLPANANKSVFDTDYQFQVVSGNQLQLTVDAGSIRQQKRLLEADLPWIASVGTTSVTTRITPAGEEGSHAELYSLDGHKKLKGDMDVNDWSINNVYNLTATGDITTTGNIEGEVITANDIVYSRRGFASLNNPSYIVHPEGDSNIRNLTAAQIRAGYLQSTGNLDVSGTSNFIGTANFSNVNASGTITANNMNVNNLLSVNRLNVSTSINAGGTITGASLVSNGGLTVAGPANISGALRSQNLTTVGNIYMGGGMYTSHWIYAPALSAPGGNTVNPDGISTFMRVTAQQVYTGFLDSDVGNIRSINSASIANTGDITTKGLSAAIAQVTGHLDVGTLQAGAIATSNITNSGSMYVAGSFQAGSISGSSMSINGRRVLTTDDIPAFTPPSP